MKRKQKRKIKIRHIGIIYAICSKKINNNSSLREDLGYKRYKQLGVSERFVNEEPYRICKKCLAVIYKREKEQ